MIIAEQIANYLFYLELGIYSPEGIDGNIYVDALPEKSQTISIFNRAGIESDILNGYEKTGIQIIYKGDENPVYSFEIAQLIFRTLTEVISKELIAGGNYIIGITTTQGQPEMMGRAKSEEFMYTMNFVVEYKV